MSFKTQKEFFDALANHKKIAWHNWDDSCFVHIDLQGRLVNERGFPAFSMDFIDCSGWSLYEEPKKMKTVTLYRYTYGAGDSIHESLWTTDEFSYPKLKLLKTETKEIQIEDAWISF
jgi:hypothetical protein